MVSGVSVRYLADFVASFRGDPASVVRIVSIVLFIAGVVGLNPAGGAAREKRLENYSAAA